MANLITEPNRTIGSIEHVGEDGFIVTAVEIGDPDFIGGKRLFSSFENLTQFLLGYWGSSSAAGVNISPTPVSLSSLSSREG